MGIDTVTDGKWTAIGGASSESLGILIQIGIEGDAPNNIPSSVTASQLASINGVSGVIGANINAYQAYIDANPALFSAPATIAEVQAMVTAVNN